MLRPPPNSHAYFLSHLRSSFKHHRSYQDLASSAEQGCRLCDLFRFGLLDAYSAFESDSEGYPLWQEGANTDFEPSETNKKTYRLEGDELRFCISLRNEDLEAGVAPFRKGSVDMWLRREIKGGLKVFFQLVVEDGSQSTRISLSFTGSDQNARV